MRSKENNLGCIWYVIGASVALAMAIYGAMGGLMS